MKCFERDQADLYLDKTESEKENPLLLWDDCSQSPNACYYGLRCAHGAALLLVGYAYSEDRDGTYFTESD